MYALFTLSVTAKGRDGYLAIAKTAKAVKAKHQNDRNALATKLSYSAGLLAHELLTLRLVKEQTPDIRPSDSLKFSHRDGKIYTVVGKGGLIREVLIPNKLAQQLERHKLNEPVKVTDRNIYYQQHYNVAGGQSWSNSFSKTSNRVLGWSRGGHGLRHTYAQERMKEITQADYERVLKIVSQEMGHFRANITLIYLH